MTRPTLERACHARLIVRHSLSNSVIPLDHGRTDPRPRRRPEAGTGPRCQFAPRSTSSTRFHDAHKSAVDRPSGDATYRKSREYASTTLARMRRLRCTPSNSHRRPEPCSAGDHLQARPRDHRPARCRRSAGRVAHPRAHRAMSTSDCDEQQRPFETMAGPGRSDQARSAPPRSYADCP